jgi:hypothetical protein
MVIVLAPRAPPPVSRLHGPRRPRRARPLRRARGSPIFRRQHRRQEREVRRRRARPTRGAVASSPRAARDHLAAPVEEIDLGGLPSPPHAVEVRRLGMRASRPSQRAATTSRGRGSWRRRAAASRLTSNDWLGSSPKASEHRAPPRAWRAARSVRRLSVSCTHTSTCLCARRGNRRARRRRRAPRRRRTGNSLSAGRRGRSVIARPGPEPRWQAPAGIGSLTTTQVMSLWASMSSRTRAMSPRLHTPACFCSTAVTVPRDRVAARHWGLAGNGRARLQSDPGACPSPACSTTTLRAGAATAGRPPRLGVLAQSTERPRRRGPP